MPKRFDNKIAYTSTKRFDRVRETVKKAEKSASKSEMIDYLNPDKVLTRSEFLKIWPSNLVVNDVKDYLHIIKQYREGTVKVDDIGSNTFSLERERNDLPLVLLGDNSWDKGEYISHARALKKDNLYHNYENDPTGIVARNTLNYGLVRVTKEFIDKYPEFIIDKGYPFYVLEFAQDKEPNHTYIKFNNIRTGDTKAERILLGTESPTFSVLEGIKNTFGLEIETVSGCLLAFDGIHNLNVASVYDGSLKNSDGSLHGGEYVTGILKGDAGVLQLQKLCNKLINRCTVNHKCSVHVHVGIKPSTQLAIALYVLAIKTQVEIGLMLPPSRRDNKYCRYMPKVQGFDQLLDSVKKNNRLKNSVIRTLYDRLLNLVCDGAQVIGKTHPLGDKCRFQTHTVRYAWINFNPCLFDRAESVVKEKIKEFPRTIEFRNHSGTLNIIKIKNWLKICMAFVKYAEQNIDHILTADTITLEDIVTYAYPKTKKTLLEYIDTRKDTFKDAKVAPNNEKKEYKEKLTLSAYKVNDLK